MIWSFCSPKIKLNKRTTSLFFEIACVENVLSNGSLFKALFSTVRPFNYLMEGWIKIHRKITEWEWYTDTNTFALFMHLLLVSNFKKTRWRGIEIEIGETIKSIQTLAEESRLSIQSVRTSIKKLKSTGELTQRQHGKHRLLKLTNYIKYQLANTEINNESTMNQQGTNRELTLDKECNKEKNVKNERIIATAAKFWEENISILNQHLCEELKILEEEHGEDNLIKAMKIAVEAGVKNVRYVKGILDNEKTNNYQWVRTQSKQEHYVIK